MDRIWLVNGQRPFIEGTTAWITKGDRLDSRELPLEVESPSGTEVLQALQAGAATAKVNLGARVGYGYIVLAHVVGIQLEGDQVKGPPSS